MFTQSWAGDVEFGPDAALEDNNSLRLRWVDHHLKGLSTGLDEEAPVTIFWSAEVVNDGSDNPSAGRRETRRLRKSYRRKSIGVRRIWPLSRMNIPGDHLMGRLPLRKRLSRAMLKKSKPQRPPTNGI